MRIMIEFYLLLVSQLFSTSAFPTKSKLTFDEFFDHTTFSLINFSPNDRYLLFQTNYLSWNTSSYESSLWIYDIQQQTRKLITNNRHRIIIPQWSPNGSFIALLLDETPTNTTNSDPYRRSLQNLPQTEQHVYLYSLASNELLPIAIGKDIPLAFTWSDNDFSLYFATIDLQAAYEDAILNAEEWKDVIQYRQDKKYEQTIIYRIDINQNDPLLPVQRNIVKNVSFLIDALLFAPYDEKLICTSVSSRIENVQDFEVYSIDLRNTSSSLVRLTDNEAFEYGLKISKDGKHLVFMSIPLSSNSGKYNNTQRRLYSINLMNGQITRLAKNFNGNINGYTIRSDGGVYILGQLGTETQIYSQQSSSEDFIQHIGWNGTYRSVTTSNKGLIAFVYSFTEQPMEVYLVNNIDQLQSAQAITNENQLFTQRDLPQAKVYKWKNEEDHQTIEGMLHYPPGKFQSKNLPLLVLIHGGPFEASLNHFYANIYYWAPLAASEGWLVLEPNYRGSTGYGDQFLNEIRYRPFSLPGKDILYGVDQLIRDGIVDPYRLAVGGYSYGGYLTNWLITQTKRFNAALSGAGGVEHVSVWGTMDFPVLFTYLFGGYPWEVPHIYQNEAAIYQLDRVRTPTHISTGENDVRVPASQSYMMERGLSYRGIPVKLLLFPNEGHDLGINPWHGKIKIREELKWLQKYGNQSELPNGSLQSTPSPGFPGFFTLFVAISWAPL